MAATENRTWTRLSPAEKKVQLKTARGIVPGEVVDVSFGGVALELDQVPQLEEGEPVNVCWRGSWMAGVVRNLKHEDRGTTRLGVQWAKSSVGA